MEGVLEGTAQGAGIFVTMEQGLLWEWGELGWLAEFYDMHILGKPCVHSILASEQAVETPVHNAGSVFCCLGNTEQV